MTKVPCGGAAWNISRVIGDIRLGHPAHRWHSGCRLSILVQVVHHIVRRSAQSRAQPPESLLSIDAAQVQREKLVVQRSGRLPACMGSQDHVAELGVVSGGRIGHFPEAGREHARRLKCPHARPPTPQAPRSERNHIKDTQGHPCACAKLCSVYGNIDLRTYVYVRDKRCILF